MTIYSNPKNGLQEQKIPDYAHTLARVVDRERHDAYLAGEEFVKETISVTKGSMAEFDKELIKRKTERMEIIREIAAPYNEGSSVTKTRYVPDFLRSTENTTRKTPNTTRNN